jgi:hypothetical protein
MATTRRALLISNPGEIGDKHYCKGVYIDIANYRALLTAAHGGTWKVDEIVTLDRPTTNQVREEITKMSGYEYTLIAFAGHGWFSSTDNATALTLRKGEHISSLELRKGANKRTMALDCCREVRPQSAYKQADLREMSKFAAAKAVIKRTPNPQLCREKFDQDVRSASEGIVVWHSSTPPEVSGDDETAGGYYSSGLFAGANRWKEQIADDWSDTSPRAYSVVEAHEAGVNSAALLSGGKQHARIEKPRTERNFFPFAVFAS